MATNSPTHVIQLALGIDLASALSPSKIEGIKHILEVDSDEEVAESYVNYLVTKAADTIKKQGVSIIQVGMAPVDQTGQEGVNEEMPIEHELTESYANVESEHSEEVAPQEVQENDEENFVETVDNEEVNKYTTNEGSISEEVNLESDDLSLELEGYLRAANFEITSAMGEPTEVAIRTNESTSLEPQKIKDIFGESVSVKYLAENHDIGLYTIEYNDLSGNKQIMNQNTKIQEQEGESV